MQRFGCQRTVKTPDHQAVACANSNILLPLKFVHCSCLYPTIVCPNLHRCSCVLPCCSSLLYLLLKQWHRYRVYSLAKTAFSTANTIGVFIKPTTSTFILPKVDWSWPSMCCRWQK